MMDENSSRKRFDKNEISDRVIELLQQKAYTQAELTKKIGCSRQSVNYTLRHVLMKKGLVRKEISASGDEIFRLVKKSEFVNSEKLNHVLGLLQNPGNYEVYLQASQDLHQLSVRGIENPDECLRIIEKHLSGVPFREAYGTAHENSAVFHLLQALIHITHTAKRNNNSYVVNRIRGGILKSLNKMFFDIPIGNPNVIGSILRLIQEMEDINSLNLLIRIITSYPQEKYDNIKGVMGDTIKVLTSIDERSVRDSLYEQVRQSKDEKVVQRLKTLLTTIRPLLGE